MDFIRDDMYAIYRKYASASIGSALALSVYSMVDTIAVGHSVGSIGTAAMAVVTPVYGMQAFMASLCGVGGSVLMTKEKALCHDKRGNGYFTESFLMNLLLTIVTWILFTVFQEPIFRFFGATDEVMPYVSQYAGLIIAFWPVFMFMIYLNIIVKSDGDPKLAFLAVATGGCCNMFGDWFFCFPMGMGMRGAALATVIGSFVQVLIPLLHFRTGHNTIRFSLPEHLLHMAGDVASIGFGSGIIEFSTVFLGVLLNNQITRYGGVAALSVYGIIATCNALIQSMFSGLGQAVQPFVSANFAAGEYERIRKFLRMAVFTCIGMEALFTAAGELFPIPLVKLFTKPTAEVLALAPSMIRLYFLTSLFMGFSILCIYLLQATLKGGYASVLSIMRGFAVSGALIILLPLVLGLNGIMIAIAAAECITALTGLHMVSRSSWFRNRSPLQANTP